MVKKHLKTLTVPNTWPIKRKGQKFVIRPKPGKTFYLSMPLALVFKNLLKACKTTKEVKQSLADNEVLVDCTRRKSPKYLLGLMDVMSIPSTKENYRMMISKTKKLYLQSIDEKEANLKISKVLNKTKRKSGATQLNLFEGRNMIVKKDDFSVGDSVVIDLKSKKIAETFKMEKGNHVYLFGGSHTGETGKIEKIEAGKDTLVTIKTKNGVFETPKKFILVVGKEKPIIKLE